MEAEQQEVILQYTYQRPDYLMLCTGRRPYNSERGVFIGANALQLGKKPPVLRPESSSTESDSESCGPLYDADMLDNPVKKFELRFLNHKGKHMKVHYCLQLVLYK
uniref:Uncharacterized protein n=1 Tax=Physcomitrium patens TaxID=3218 RepID=A0A2K1II44_PHYPA|nr:hypothetical protein PHYPA_027632 [Physcomitrium patens]